MFLKYCFVLYIDLLKLYNSKDLDPDFSPHSLQNKVQFDIRYYLCRQANENFHAMTKEFFQLVYDPETQMTYVKKVSDELTKNHKETNNEVLTGFMPQFLDSTGHPHPLCPIRSFENYVNNLNENIPNLWQQPLKSFPKDITKPWYKSEALGHNTLEKFLGRLSDKNNLSEHYTNHCIRVTSVTNLTRANFSAKQIMSITGHKSIQSLTIYQKVKEDEKHNMGISLMYNLLNPQEALKIHEQMEEQSITNQQENQPPAKLRAIEAPSPEVAPIPKETHALDSQNMNILPLNIALEPYKPPAAPQVSEEQDFDLMKIIADIQNDNKGDNDLILAVTQYEAQSAGNAVSTSKIIVKKSSPKKAVNTFAGCKFGNIGTLNIYINKN